MKKEVSDVLIHGWQPEISETHRRWLLVNHPVGLPTVDDFMLVEDVIPAPPPDKLLVRGLYTFQSIPFSVWCSIPHPAMRKWFPSMASCWATWSVKW